MVADSLEIHVLRTVLFASMSPSSSSHLGLCGSISITGWFHVHTTIHYILNQCINNTYIYTYIDMFNGPFSRKTSVSRHQKGKPFCILMKQYTTGGRGISWTTCTAFLQRLFARHLALSRANFSISTSF